jgi:hypothetical protein
MIWEDESDQHVGVMCFAGCSRSAICAAWGIEETDLYVQDSRPQQPKKSGLSLMDLCKEKWIHPRDLEIMQLGITEGLKYEGRPAVRIPYYHMDGTEHTRYRIRTDVSAKKGSKWSAGDDDLIPYGLQRLADARAAKYLVIVEGESDCWTLWGHRFPALGIPGAQHAKKIQPEYLTDIKQIFIVQEPDEAGRKFACDIRKRLIEIGFKGQIATIDFQQTTGAKDPNELHKRDVKAFPDAFKRAMEISGPKKPTVKLLRDLQSEALPDMKWAIPDIVPEGVTLLCGKPKLGKSWLLLSLLISVASGGVALGNVAVEQGEVLYISLEDKQKRLQKRTNILNQHQAVSDTFYYATEWSRLNEGGLDDLEEWIQEHPNVRLIGIDTWAKIKPKSRNLYGQTYEEDYDAFAPLQELAAKYQISIIVVHHMRKAESEDPLDMVLGSTANAGAVDGFMLLYRKRGEDNARLFVTGRDIEEEQELLLTFQKERATWKIKGDANESTVATTPERQRIVDALEQGPMSVKDLAEQISKNINTTRNHLVILRNEGKVLLENNTYRLVTTSKTSNTSNTSNLSETETRKLPHCTVTSNPMSEPEKPAESTLDQEPARHMTSKTSNPTSNPMSEPEKPTESTLNHQLTSLTSLTSPNTQNEDISLPTDQRPSQSITLDDFFTIGKAHGYPEIVDLDLQSGMIAWNRFANAHRISLPDVVARLGGVQQTTL